MIKKPEAKAKETGKYQRETTKKASNKNDMSKCFQLTT